MSPQSFSCLFSLPVVQRCLRYILSIHTINLVGLFIFDLFNSMRIAGISTVKSYHPYWKPHFKLVPAGPNIWSLRRKWAGLVVIKLLQPCKQWRPLCGCCSSGSYQPAPLIVKKHDDFESGRMFIHSCSGFFVCFVFPQMAYKINGYVKYSIGCVRLE